MRRATGWVPVSLVCLLVLAPNTGASTGDGPLVYMPQVRPITITPQSVSVQPNGDAAVIVVLGETTIPRPVRFSLGRASLAHLRSLVARSGIARLRVEAAIPLRRLMYTVRADGNSVRVVQGR